MQKGRPQLRHGLRVAILRPLDPERAVRRARELVGVRGDVQEALDAILDEQAYVWVGIWGKDEAILNDRLEVIGKLEPGDSFVSLEYAVRRFGQASS